MVFVEEAKKLSARYVLTALIGIISVLGARIYADVSPQALTILQSLSKNTLLTIIGLLILAFLLLAALTIALYVKSRNKLTPRFGVFWDSKDYPNPYCNVCKNQFSFVIPAMTNRPVMTCTECNIEPELMTENGFKIHLKTARKLLSGEKKLDDIIRDEE